MELNDLRVLLSEYEGSIVSLECHTKTWVLWPEVTLKKTPKLMVKKPMLIWVIGLVFW